MLRTFYSKYSYSLGLLSFLLFSVSLLIGHGEESANHLFVLVKASLILLSVVFYTLSCNEHSGESVRFQFAFLSFGIIVYEVLLLAATGKTVFYIRDYPAILSNILWLAAGLISVIRFRKTVASGLQNALKDRSTIILIGSSLLTALIVILLSIEPDGIRFTWDSDTLYEYIYRLDYESLYDAKLLTFHSHVTVVYGHILVLFKLLFKDIRLAFFLLNSLCIICASIGTTFLLRSLLPGKAITDYILGNLLFIFSPWVCGLSTYHMYDFYIWCLFPLLLYFLSTKKWIGYWVIGVFITFSKATGLIVFGSVCIGILATDFFTHLKKTKSFFRSLRALGLNVKYWFYLAVALVFYLYFKTGIAESTQFEDTIIGFDPSHIAHLIKMYTVCNYNWVFSILSILSIIAIFFVKSVTICDKSKTTLIIIIISDFLFVIFNCICITYRLPRYMDSHINTIYLLGIIFLIYLSVKPLKYLLISLICLVNFVGGFYSIDPVSKKIFDTVDVGDHTIVNYEMKSKTLLGDSIVCNREYYSYEILLDKALTYIMEDRSEEDKIMFSLGKSPITWGFSGGRYSYEVKDGKEYFDLFYDTAISGLANGYSYDYYNSPEMIHFDMRYIFPEESAKDVIDSIDANIIYYLYMPTLNHQKEQPLIDGYNIISENEFTYRGWQMNCIKLEK